MGVTGLILALQAHKAKIKGVSKALYNCYCNLLWHKNDQNLLNNNGHLFDIIFMDTNETVW